MCISWTIKGLISLMHGVTMKNIPQDVQEVAGEKRRISNHPVSAKKRKNKRLKKLVFFGRSANYSLFAGVSELNPRKKRGMLAISCL